MTDQRKKLLMIGLLGLWGLAALWRFFGVEEPTRVPLKYMTGQAGPREGSGAGVGGGLQVASLDSIVPGGKKGGGEFKTPKNIFAPLGMREEQAATKPRTAGRRSSRRGLAGLMPTPAPSIPTPPPPSPEELAAQAARDELGRYRYMGYMARQGRNQAVLAKEQKLHIVWTGETIEGRVMVKAITPTAVTLKEVPSQVEQIVQLQAGEGTPSAQ
jgi:hypothetical protein